MLIFTINYNAIPFTTVFSQFFTFLLLPSHLLHATVCIIKSFLCHDIKQAMSYHIMEFYVTTIVASLVHANVIVIRSRYAFTLQDIVVGASQYVLSAVTS